MAIRAFLLDLDGTVYWGQREVPGAARFVALARNRGIRPFFVTNRANRTPADIREHLRSHGITADTTDILTSAQATAMFIGRGSAFCVGEDGLQSALSEQGIVLTDQDPDFVVVSYDRQFTYDKLTKACRLIESGARFLATNPDRALKTENGVVPGTGAIVAAVAAGCGVEPICIGKPERRIFDMAVARLELSPNDVVAVGDNIETDIPAGIRAGLRTVLLLTGVSTRSETASSSWHPTWIADNFEDLETILQDTEWN